MEKKRPYGLSLLLSTLVLLLEAVRTRTGGAGYGPAGHGTLLSP